MRLEAQRHRTVWFPCRQATRLLILTPSAPARTYPRRNDTSRWTQRPNGPGLCQVHTNDAITQNILIRSLRREHRRWAPPRTAAPACRCYRRVDHALRSAAAGIRLRSRSPLPGGSFLCLWCAYLPYGPITAWLDAGQPEPARAAGRVRQAVMGVIGAAASDADCHFPSPAHLEGPPS